MVEMVEMVDMADMVEMVEMVDMADMVDMAAQTCVDMVRRVVTPRATLAGTDRLSSQKDTCTLALYRVLCNVQCVMYTVYCAMCNV